MKGITVRQGLGMCLCHDGLLSILVCRVGLRYFEARFIKLGFMRGLLFVGSLDKEFIGL